MLVSWTWCLECLGVLKWATRTPWCGSTSCDGSPRVTMCTEKYVTCTGCTIVFTCELSIMAPRNTNSDMHKTGERSYPGPDEATAKPLSLNSREPNLYEENLKLLISCLLALSCSWRNAATLLGCVGWKNSSTSIIDTHRARPRYLVRQEFSAPCCKEKSLVLGHSKSTTSTTPARTKGANKVRAAAGSSLT